MQYVVFRGTKSTSISAGHFYVSYEKCRLSSCPELAVLMVELMLLRKFTCLCIGILITLIPCQVKFVQSTDWRYEACKPRNCGNGPDISYPFYIMGEESANGTLCGYPGFEVSCKENKPVFLGSSSEYIIESISYGNQSIRLIDDVVITQSSCIRPSTFNFDRTSLHLGTSVVNMCMFYNCTDAFPVKYRENQIDCASNGSSRAFVVIDDGKGEIDCSEMPCQSYVTTPVDLPRGSQLSAASKINYTGMLENGFTLTWAGISCSECDRTGGHCGTDANGTTVCYCPDQPHGSYCNQGKSKLGIVVGAAGGGLLIVVILLILLLVGYRKKGIDRVSEVLRKNRFSLKLDLEKGSIFFEVPVFSYYELKKTTNNFDKSKQLGAGGFGTVYYGKLKDGREVAVKCLYEHTFNRMEQFKNEVQILTRLRHRNLVSLYGCTSRRSRQLLLVYEYISNGTLAEHLHGDKAKERSLPWSVRMSIAIETAGALAYLHASDIIHRDVKTNNILLDHTFCVKVADFGLSKLFPTEVSHISTAPQGTPGYVDPEYHQCYQLTDRSDVYSFGVVLVELISGMPAVDMTRNRSEINLAQFAISMIQKRDLDRLIDPSLQAKTYPDVKRMIASVAGLAFRCLQLEKEMRPTMDEVVEALEAIERGNANFSEISEVSRTSKNILPSPESEKVSLLKNTKKKSDVSSNPMPDISVGSPTTVLFTPISGATTIASTSE